MEISPARQLKMAKLELRRTRLRDWLKTHSGFGRLRSRDPASARLDDTLRLYRLRLTSLTRGSSLGLGPTEPVLKQPLKGQMKGRLRFSFASRFSLTMTLIVLTVAFGGRAVAEDSAKADASSTLAIRNARVVTIDSRGELSMLLHGTVVVRDGRIEAVGESLPMPPGAEVIELEGHWLLPGFIDAHYLSARYQDESDEYVKAITEDFESVAALDPWEPEFGRQLSLGATTLAVSPGNRNVIGGKVRLVKTVPCTYPLEVVESPTSYKASLGLEVLGGRGLPRFPTALSGAVKLFAEWLEARPQSLVETRVSSSIAIDGSKLADETGRNRPRIVVHIETRTQAERLLELVRDKPFVPVLLDGGSVDARGWERLKEYPYSILGPYRLGHPLRVLKIAGALERQGKIFAFASDGSRLDLLTTAVLAMRYGLSLRGAVAALTTYPAKIYGVDDRLGRIAPGQDADMVEWSGNPFSLNAHVVRAWVDGGTAYERLKEAP